MIFSLVEAPDILSVAGLEDNDRRKRRKTVRNMESPILDPTPMPEPMPLPMMSSGSFLVVEPAMSAVPVHSTAAAQSPVPGAYSRSYKTLKRVVKMAHMLAG